MVFHRFLEGSGDRELVITVNGEKVQPVEPVRPGRAGDAWSWPPQRFEVAVGDAAGTVTLQRFVLPSGTISARRRSSSGCPGR